MQRSTSKGRGRTRQPRVFMILSAVLLTMAACRGGCRRPSRGEDTAPSALALFPADTRIVLSVDFQSIRGSPLWQELSRGVQQDPEDRRLISSFTERTGLDPFRHVHGLVAAFPDEARKDGAFALYFVGEGFDEKRLLTYARDEARLRGKTIEQRLHRGHTLWVGPPPAEGPPTGQVAGFFLDGKRFVLAGGGWAEKMIDLRQKASGATSAASNGMLVDLAERVGRGRSVWLAAIVPDGTRQRLLTDSRFGAQASVMRFGGALDLAPALQGQLQAELSNAEDARAMAQRLAAFLEAARRNPQALLLGAGPYLEAITAEAKGPTLLVKIRLDEARTRELATRLASLARLRSR
jgi:hypothetical protein